MQEQEITALLAERREEGMDALLRHYGPLMRYVIGTILQDPRDREECLWEQMVRQCFFFPVGSTVRWQAI